MSLTENKDPDPNFLKMLDLNESVYEGTIHGTAPWLPQHEISFESTQNPARYRFLPNTAFN
jgi:hypothetical protein